MAETYHVIQLGDDNTVRVTHHGLGDTTQGYEIDAFYTPTLRHPLFSVNQLDFTESTATFGDDKCYISFPESPITITGHRVNDLYFISLTASAHIASTLDGLPTTPQITVPSTDASTHPSQSLSKLAAPTISKSTRRM